MVSIEIFILMIILSLLVYFLYELITTKRLQNLVKAAPFFLGVLLFNLLFGAALYAGYEKMLTFQPLPEEIVSVSFMNNDQWNEQNNSLKYNELMVYEVAYQEEELRQIVSDSLADTIRLVRNGELVNKGVESLNWYTLKLSVEMERYTGARYIYQCDS